MPDTVNTTDSEVISVVSPEFLCGRHDILTSEDELTVDNVINEVNQALVYHNTNIISEDYLYWYRRGLQPILNRTKDRNTYVLTKCIENHAEEIVAFKDGFFLQSPCRFVSRKNGKQAKIDKLNEFVYRSGKYIADNRIVDWFHTVGKGVLYIEETPDNDIPFRCYCVDPRSAFVVYSMRPGNRPVYAVNVVTNDSVAKIDVYTESTVFRLSGGYMGEKTTPFPGHETLAVRIDSVEPNQLGHIPIIEYRYNSVNTSAFEQVVYILDALNQVQSGRIDAVEQFVQSVIVAVNCQFEDGVTADQIKKQGMIILSSIGENKADFKIISEELNQTQTQTLANNLYEQALRIVCMPITTRGGYSTSGTQVLYRDGWENAGASARNTEDLFRQSNAYAEEIFLDILERRGILKNLAATDFELNFDRNETANMQSKAQAFSTLVAAGWHPELSAKMSGITNDPVADVKMSEKWLKMIWGDPDKVGKTEESQNATGFGEESVKYGDKDNTLFVAEKDAAPTEAGTNDQANTKEKGNGNTDQV